MSILILYVLLSRKTSGARCYYNKVISLENVFTRIPNSPARPKPASVNMIVLVHLKALGLEILMENPTLLAESDIA
jgi:hypothetical protein